MGDKGGANCTGFVIGPYILATAAHCITLDKAKGGTVDVGFGKDAAGFQHLGKKANVVKFLDVDHFPYFSEPFPIDAIPEDYAFIQVDRQLPGPFPLIADPNFPPSTAVPDLSAADFVETSGYPLVVKGQSVFDQYQSLPRPVVGPLQPGYAGVGIDVSVGNSGGPVMNSSLPGKGVVGIISVANLSANANGIMRLNVSNIARFQHWVNWRPAGEVSFINAPVNGAAYDIFSVPAFQAQATAFGAAKSAGSAGKGPMVAGDVSNQVVWKSDLDGVLGSGATLPAEVTNQLSVGMHRISAEVPDPNGGNRSFSAAAVVEIDGPTGGLGASSDLCFVYVRALA